jgi:hypothetical protein
MEPLFIVFAGLHVVYLMVLLLVFLGLSKLRHKTCGKTPFVSIVIAARNEEWFHSVNPGLQVQNIR